MVTGSRLPFEKQQKPDDYGEDESTDESGSEYGRLPTGELEMRLSRIDEILEGLYKLGFKIRNPHTRTISHKASLHKRIDPISDVDVFHEYSKWDEMHVYGLLQFLRAGRSAPTGYSDFLAPRLAAAITRRRRRFEYWSKMFKDSVHHEPLEGITHAIKKEDGDYEEPLSQMHEFQSEFNNDNEIDDIASYSKSSTAHDTESDLVEFPVPPKSGLDNQDFTCPYCFIRCSREEAHGKGWR